MPRPRPWSRRSWASSSPMPCSTFCTMPSASPEPALLEIDGLAYGYGARVLQHDLNFAVAGGEVLCVIGGSGCGKSTLLRVLTGLLPPLRGRVRIDGQDFWAAPPDEQG